MAHFCNNDGSLHLAAACRTFDFTQHFEDGILSLLPQTLFVVLAISGSVISLAYAKPRVKAISARLVLKLVLNFGLIATQAAVLAGAVRIKHEVPAQSIWIASNVFGLLTALVFLPFSYLSHMRSIRPSMLITSYLIIIVLCDAARIRTAYLVGINTTLFANSLIAAMAFKIAITISENLEKNEILLPQYKGSAHSFESANTFSDWLLVPLLYVFFAARKRVLSLEDLKGVGTVSEVDECRDRFNQAWDANGHKSILRAILRGFWIDVSAQIFPKLIYIACLLAQPWLLSRIVQFLNGYTGDGVKRPAYIGWGITAAFIVIYLLLALSNARYHMASVSLATKFRAAMVGGVYAKCLQSSTVSGRKDLPVDISAATTLMSVDVERCALASLFIPEIWGAFVIIGFTLYFLYEQVKLGMLGALGVITFTFLTTPEVSKWAKKNQAAFMKTTGARVKFTTFLVDNMLAVKMAGLLQVLQAEAIVLRRKELAAMTAFWNRMRWAVTLGGSATTSIAFWTYLIYTLISLHHPHSYPPLDVNRLFTSFSLIALLTGPLNDATQGLPFVVAAYASLLRLQQFLASNHVISPPTSPVTQIAGTNDTAKSPDALFTAVDVGFHYATLDETYVRSGAVKEKGKEYPSDISPFLHISSLTIPANKLIFIFGKVGSGKSLFLKSLLGETWSTKPVVPLRETAYCPQDPWMLSATVKENITLYRAFNKEWYDTILEACALPDDLARLENGDETTLTSNGLSLSGGMRHRVALARALYSRADTYVLDDIFSALDTKTSEHVFRRLFDAKEGLLARKSVIVATHAVHFAPRAGYVIVLEDGAIVSAEAPTSSREVWESLSKNEPEEADVTHTAAITKVDTRPAPAEPTKKDATSPKKATAKPEVTVDLNIGVKLLALYARHCGVFNFFMLVILQTLNAAVFSTLSIFLEHFARADNGVTNSPDGRYLGGLAVYWVCSVGLYISAYSYRTNIVIPLSGMSFHRHLLNSVGNAPLSWFTTTPSGQIVNRFSQDLFAVDFEFTPNITGTIFQLVSIVVTAVVAIVANYYLAPLMLALALIFIVLERFYIAASRQIRRLDSAAKSPLYSLIGDSIKGLHVIRSFNAQGVLTERCDNMINISQKAYFARFASQQWLTLVLDLMAASVAILLVILSVVLRNSQSIGLLAVSLSNLINTSRQLDSLMRTWTETENGMVALERLREYSKLESEEAKFRSLGTDGDGERSISKGADDGVSVIEPDSKREQDLTFSLALSSLPPAGNSGTSVTFRNVVVRYNDNSETALKDFSFSIHAGTTLGIAGRSGSGKSTLLLTLLRFINPESGTVMLNDRDTSNMTLAQLRAHFSVLSQDPLCPPLSIRQNLDPTGKHDDVKLWDILNRVQLESVVSMLDGKLDFILDGKDSLSRGQKQLLCLGRIMLEDRSVVLIDEGTSSMDEETQTIVQNVLKESFAGKTIINIAHRTSTIIGCDKILVIDTGRVVEFGSPMELLASETSSFKALHENN